MTTTTYLRRILTALIIGIIAGPILGGVLGLVLLSLGWTVQSFIEGWSSETWQNSLPYTLVFGLLIAPVCVSVGALVGGIMGAFGRFFGSLVNAASFGGAVGTGLGVLVAPLVFGGPQGGDVIAVFVGVITMGLVGSLVALLVKRIQRPPKNI